MGVALTALVNTVRGIVEDEKGAGLFLLYRVRLRKALKAYEKEIGHAAQHYALLLDEDHPLEDPTPSNSVACSYCEDAFRPKRKGQRFCCSTCRKQGWLQRNVKRWPYY